MKDIFHAILVFMIITSPVWVITYIHSSRQNIIKENCIETDYYYDSFSGLKKVYKCNKDMEGE